MKNELIEELLNEESLLHRTQVEFEGESRELLHRMEEANERRARLSHELSRLEEERRETNERYARLSERLRQLNSRRDELRFEINRSERNAPDTVIAQQNRQIARQSRTISRLKSDNRRLALELEAWREMVATHFEEKRKESTDTNVASCSAWNLD